MIKEMKFEDDAKLSILKGVEKLASAVKITMGPCGKNVIIENPGYNPHITKDGVSVARSIELDDRYENGVHDLLKFIKFGYGRATDHGSKDIRMKYITRSKGIDYVKKYDHIISDDLYHWLEYTQFSEKEFWKIAEEFRDPSVWWIESGKWYKDNIWGKSSSYGNVIKNSVDERKYLKKEDK